MMNETTNTTMNETVATTILDSIGEAKSVTAKSVILCKHIVESDDIPADVREAAVAILETHEAEKKQRNEAAKSRRKEKPTDFSIECETKYREKIMEIFSKATAPLRNADVKTALGLSNAQQATQVLRYFTERSPILEKSYDKKGVAYTMKQEA